MQKGVPKIIGTPFACLFQKLLVEDIPQTQL